MSADVARLSYLRSRFGESVFPLTCSQYGISYPFAVFDTFISMLTVPIYPCDAIVCLSRASRTAHENRMADIAERYSRAWNQPRPVLPRCEVIPCGFDTQRFCPRDQNQARTDLGLPLDNPIVLCLGRIRIQDKMDWTPLLLAFRRAVRATNGSVLLVLAGSNPSDYGDHLIAQAQQLGLGEAVRTFFNLPHMALPSLYAA
jgi:glycosyltransferase involved in cell wall biosynthesis